MWQNFNILESYKQINERQVVFLDLYTFELCTVLWSQIYNICSCLENKENWNYKVFWKTKKPRFCVPGDLPWRIVQEFVPQLSTPVGKLIRDAFPSKVGIFFSPPIILLKRDEYTAEKK